MKGKTDKQFLFEVKLGWQEKNEGILSAVDVDGTIDVATPHAFGGEGKPWSPEHLFLSAVSSCFMTTYLAFAKKLQFNISAFECNTIGQIKIVNGKYKFTLINVYPKITVADESLKEKANLALEKTHKYCLISNSINAAIFYHSAIKFEQTLQTI
jgi:peroxiredoxin-like protein